jgi:cob(I)alamin adenosyltransferase
LKDRDILPNLEVLRYLNRLADLLFMLARYEDRERPLDLVNKADRDKGLAE